MFNSWSLALFLLSEFLSEDCWEELLSLASGSVPVVYANFIHEYWNQHFNIKSWCQIWETFHSNFIYSQIFCQGTAAWRFRAWGLKSRDFAQNSFYFQNFCQKTVERQTPKEIFSNISFLFEEWIQSEFSIIFTMRMIFVYSHRILQVKNASKTRRPKKFIEINNKKSNILRINKVSMENIML